MTVEIISCSISTKVWDWAGVELATPGSAVGHTSVVRNVNTDWAVRPGLRVSWLQMIFFFMFFPIISLYTWPV